MPAPDLTAADLATALRVEIEDPDIALHLGRVLEAASELVSAVTLDAPQGVSNEAAIRVASWLYDTDPAHPRNGNPMRASGADQLLARWRKTTLVGPDPESA